MIENVEKFLEHTTQSISKGTFVKLSLGNYKGSEPHLQKILVRLVNTKKGTRLYFNYRETARDTAKNYDLDLGLGLISEAFDGGFSSGHLFTTENDIQLAIKSKDKSRLTVGKATFTAPPKLEHDREKKIQVDRASFYLKALGITDDAGRVRDKQQDKWRQINKFVEVLSGLVDKSELSGKTQLNIVDMGCGKGYLTFAAYDYFKNTRDVDVKMTGVDTKADIVTLCNEIARSCSFEKLTFVDGTIESFDLGDVDILIALHACNTATDDALFKGIKAGAALIAAAPCCHLELRPQITPPEMLRDILKHGVMLERTAETLTDGLRSLLLERSGYSTKLFEFISTDHTPKNNMLVGTLSKTPADPRVFQQQIDEIKEIYGIREQHLEKLLEILDPR